LARNFLDNFADPAGYPKDMRAQRRDRLFKIRDPRTTRQEKEDYRADVRSIEREIARVLKGTRNLNDKPQPPNNGATNVEDEYEDMSGYEDQASADGYHPQLGVRLVFNEDGYYTQDEEPFDTSVSHLVLEPPFQVWRKFEPLSDGGYTPHWHRRDSSISLQAERESLGDTDQNAWPVSKFTKARMDPWVLCFIMYLMNPRTLEIFTFQSHTAGGAIAVREYKAMVVRRNRQVPARRGELPVVRLDIVPFKTRYNMRQRPCFTLIGYGRDPSAPDPSQQIGGPQGPKLIEGKAAEPAPSAGKGQTELDDFAAGREQAAATTEAPKGKPAMTTKRQDVPDDSLADILQDEVPHQ
jgi:hypothetical protein